MAQFRTLPRRSLRAAFWGTGVALTLIFVGCTHGTKPPPTNTSCTGLNCAAGSVCRSGDCQVVTCSGNAGCASGEVCDPTGRCRISSDPCATTTCASGTVCRSGKCEVLTCTSDTECGSGERCGSDGVCRTSNDPCATANCMGDTVCRSGECKVVICSGDTDCAAGEKCSSGVCLPAGNACASAAACPMGEVCQNGSCAAVPCTSASDCAAGETCSGGLCRSPADPCATTACPAGQVCRPQGSPAMGQCSAVPCMGDGDCARGEKCGGGVCRPPQDPCAGVVCPSPDVCHLPGQCTAATAPNCSPVNQADGTNCGAGSVCMLGACMSGCFIAGAFYAADAPNPANSCQLCQPAVSTTDWSSVADGASCGDAGICQAGMCGGGCFIDGAVVRAGAVDSSNACLVCQPSSSTTSWTPVSDGAVCGNGSVCVTGACHAGCFIQGAFVAPDGADPTHLCQSCQPAASTSVWTVRSAGDVCHTAANGCDLAEICDGNSKDCPPDQSKPDGTSCDDGVACTQGDVCKSGVCAGTAYTCPAATQCQDSVTCDGQGGCTVVKKSNGTPCDDGNPCSKNDACANGVCAGTDYSCPAQSTCQPAIACDGKGGCNITNATDGTACDDGNPSTKNDSCRNGACVGTPYTCPPANQCQASVVPDGNGGCTVTNMMDGVTCDDGNPCTFGEHCSSGVCGGGTPYSCANVTLNQCQQSPAVCDGTGSCTITNLPNGTSCSDGNACTQNDTCQSGTCTSGPAVGCVPDSSQCQAAGTCDPSTGACSFTALPDGSSCGFGEVCSGGKCQAGCYIEPAGMFYPVNYANNNCQTCQPALSTTSWTNEGDGTSCGAGEVCDQGACKGECYIGGQFYAAGAANPASPTCQSCEPAVNTTDWTSNVGTSCGTGKVCDPSGTCQSGCFIYGQYYAAMASPAGNICSYCDPAKSTTTFQTLADLTQCNTSPSQFCQAGSCDTLYNCPDHGSTCNNSGCAVLYCPPANCCVGLCYSTTCNGQISNQPSCTDTKTVECIKASSGDCTPSYQTQAVACTLMGG